MIARLRRSLAFWQERNRIIKEMQDGEFTAIQTVHRLQQHAKPGGRERLHVWSCRQGFAECKCPYRFDVDPKKYTSLKAAYDFAEEALPQ